jgi:hypothetical protein
MPALFSEKFSGKVTRSLVVPGVAMRRNRRCCRYLTIALFACAATALIPTANAWADDSADPLNALMMGGTGAPTPSIEWQDRIIAAYVDPATGGNYTPVLVPTPESEAYSSAPVGLQDLQGAMAQQEADFPGQPYLVEGYSQRSGQPKSSSRSTATPRSTSSPPPSCRCSTRCAAWACPNRCSTSSSPLCR